MAAAAMEPTDTQRVMAMPRANAAISMRKPTGPKTNTRQAAATAMPLPPLNLSQGLKMWPSVQPAKARARAKAPASTGSPSTVAGNVAPARL